MSFIQGKRVLVTGGAGFLGQNVCRSLQAFQPGILLAPRKADYDLRDQRAIQQLFADHAPEIVVHLAAVVGGIGANQMNPGRYLYDNAIMGIQLMHEAMRHEVNKFVVLGTICSYPKHTSVPFKEEDLWNGYPEETNAPYGLAKKLLLVQAQAYRQQYGLNAITLLPVNLYGPGDNFHPDSSHVIPALIRKAVEARDNQRRCIEVWGTGRATREFLFVRDAATAIALATEHYNEPEPVNIGSGMEISIRELAELIFQLCGYQGGIQWDTSRPDGQPRRCLDTKRARQAFGFQAATNFRDGLKETIEWYEWARKAQERLGTAA
jgi:GDP-L-fucose synthase